MGIFGGSKSKSSTTTNSYGYDNRIAAEDGAIIAREGSAVTINDLSDDALSDLLKAGTNISEGALEANRRVSETAIEEFRGLSEDSLDFGVDIQNRALDSLDDAYNEAYGFGRDALSAVDDAGARLTSIADQVFGAVSDSLGVADTALTRAFASTPGGGVDVARDAVKYVVPVAVLMALAMLMRG